MRPHRRSLAALLPPAALLVATLALAACGGASSGNGSASSDADGPAIETGTAPPPPDLIAPGTTPPATDASGTPLIQPPLSNAPVAAADAGTPGKVDVTCTSDADCAVKDVGSCCGYSPACVNTNSPTFPEQVKAECAKNDLQSTCGFRDISGCQCVEGRCSALDAGEGPVR
jgi:hypothetical protein